MDTTAHTAGQPLADRPAGHAWLDRLLAATNAHDLAALVDCFAEDYVNETPAHPARGFRGREQVARNWAQIFAGVPDVRAEVSDLSVDGDRVWSEWWMHGTRVDGARHEMTGVIVFDVRDGRAVHARFHLEPVERGGGDADAAVREAVATSPERPS